MRTFDPYPITINGSMKDEAVRAPIMARYKKGEITEGEKITQLSLAGANKWDYIADSSPEAVRYEGRVRGLLSYIRSNTLGKCLLDMLRTGGVKPIWIVPYDSEDAEMYGEGNAMVNMAPYAYVHQHAVRLAITPDNFTYTTEWGKTPGSRADEVLFHEMVHAYRHAHPAVQVGFTSSLPGYGDHEELLAHQMTNVYRSMWGAKRFVLTYKNQDWLGSAEACEAALRSNKPAMEVLERFIANDPLSKRVAKIKTLYNPFADFDRIRRGPATTTKRLIA